MKRIVLATALLSATLSANERDHFEFEPDETIEIVHSVNFQIKNGVVSGSSGLRAILGASDTETLLNSLEGYSSVQGTCQTVSTPDTSGDAICELNIDLHRDRNGEISGAIVSGNAGTGDIFKVRLKGPCKRIPFLIESAKEAAKIAPQPKGEK